MKYKNLIKKEINAVSPVIATIIMICLVVAVVAPMAYMIDSIMNDPDSEGFWSSFGKGNILADLDCPCDLLIKSSSKPSINCGYTNAGANRELNTNMDKATLVADDGEKEQYKIRELHSNEANDLLYQVTCWDNGKYDLTIKFIKLGKTLSVMANDIEIDKSTEDRYQIFWENPPRVLYRRDKNGDGTYEIEMTVDTATTGDTATIITNAMVEDGAQGGDDSVGDSGDYECDDDQLSLTVELEGVTVPLLTRCITINLKNCGTGDSETIQQEVAFTNGVGSVVIDVADGKEYTCISVKDPLHTLRQTDTSLTKEEGIYQASFTGENALIGGELNGDGVIDMLDFGTFSAQFGTDFGTGDTTCDTQAPHSDISGNGFVGTEDFTFISENFFKTDEAECCED